MSVTVETRGKWLGFRISHEGMQWRETTGCKDTERSRKALQKKADAMNVLMSEGHFVYGQWFPNGVKRAHYAPPEPVVVTVPTVREYAEATWLPRMPGATRKSLEDTRRSALRAHILPAFGDSPLDTVTRALLLDFRGFLTRPKPQGRGVKMKTARDVIDGVFRALYRDARRDGLVSGDPFADLDWPDKVVPEPDPFDADERDLLCAYFRDKDRFWHPLVFTRFWTGVRPSEARALRFSDYDAKRGLLHIRRSRTYGEDHPPKTSKSRRSIPLHEGVRQVLRARPAPLSIAPDDFLFVTPAGNPIDEDRFVYQHWHRALRATGIRPRKFHATRHTFISCALTQGVNLKWLADYAGTSVAMIESHYGRWLGGDTTQLALLDAKSASPRRRRA